MARKTIHVLVVDDNRRAREGMLALLATWSGCVVVGCAADGQQAVEKVAWLHPDAVLIDVCMPVMNGLQATHVIKQTDPAVWVVVTSLYPAYREEAFENQADRFVLKGSPSEELLQALTPPSYEVSENDPL
jgi:two-component system response regulator LytT